MSADNWATCPVCKDLAEANQQVARDIANQSYGKVSADEYERLKTQAEKIEPHEDTLREDYEIGVGEDGKFSVSYRCLCDICGFQFEYRHKQDVQRPE